jgi:hypothetical protein
MEIGAALLEAHLERLAAFNRKYERMQELKELYADYPNQTLIDAVIRCGTGINKSVPNNGFPAFDIAIELDTTGKKPSPKQRQALVNVLASYNAFSEKRE